MFVFLHLFTVTSDSRDFPHIQLDLLQNLQNGGKSKPEPGWGSVDHRKHRLLPGIHPGEASLPRQTPVRGQGRHWKGLSQ